MQNAVSHPLALIHYKALNNRKQSAPSAIHNASNIEQCLYNIFENLELKGDEFGHNIHALSTTRDCADRISEQTVLDAARMLKKPMRKLCNAMRRTAMR